MPWFTDTQILALPAFAEIRPEQIPDLAAAAGRLYAQIGAVPAISDADLRSWAEGAGIGPEVFNMAAAALRQAGKAVQIDDGPLAPLASSTGPATLGDLAATVGDSIPTRHLTKDELRTVAERLGIDVPKSATKAEIAESVSRHA